MKRFFTLLLTLVLAASFARAQVNAGVPADVFYLMPEMTQGTLLFKDRSVNGKFNICAVDQTLRFLNEKGVELALDNDADLRQVNFPEVTFLHADGAYYRLYPVSDAAYVAVKRDVTVMTDTKNSSYGMASSTTAVEEVGMVQSGTHLVSFNDARQYPYKMTETAYLYGNGRLVRWNKKNCIKCFPLKKAEIEAWFAANKKADPADVQLVIDLCKEWGG
jgi:hypothetical protein